MKAVFNEYGQFIVSLIVFIGVLALVSKMIPAYKAYSRVFVSSITGVPYQETEYTRW